MDYSKKPEKENPQSGANIISQLLFLWMIPVLHNGRNGIKTDDLTQHLVKDNSNVLGDQLEREWYKQEEISHKKNRKNILQYALFYTYFRSIFILGLLQTVSILLRSLVPFLLWQLLKQLQHPLSSPATSTSIISINQTNKNLMKNSFYADLLNDTMTNSEQTEEFNWFENIWNNVYCVASGIIILLILGSLSGLHSEYQQRMIGARMRIACSSLIYRKTLRLSKKSSGQISTGYLINLISNDVARLDTGFIFANMLWTLPLQIALICYLTWQRIGGAAYVGIIVLLLQTIPLQTGIGRLIASFRIKVAKRTDLRVGIMKEIIQGIQVIKMYAWEKSFHAILAEFRRRELKQIRYAAYLGCTYLSARFYTARATLFVTIITISLLGQNIRADIIFSLVHYFNCLQLTTAIFYPLAISFGTEAIAAINRLQIFLVMEENPNAINQVIQKEPTSECNSHLEQTYAVEIKNVSAAWTDDCSTSTLNDIVLNVKDGQLCAIIGPVGAGKSSLLHLLLKELPIRAGKVFINGDISYSAQEPWLFSSTVRNNILFGETYDKKRYNEIIKYCSLETDLKQLPYGDRSIVGEHGVILSGGQRARISLARAIYKQAKIYLLDDPLSAVDSHVGKYLFEQVIGPNGYLAARNATRILVTHQVNFLKTADVIVIIENGRIMREGSYEELSNSDLTFAQILSKSNCTDVEQEIDKNHIANQTDVSEYECDATILTNKHRRSNSLFGSKRSRKISISSDDLISNTEDEKEVVEQQYIGKVSFTVWQTYFQCSGSIYKLIVLLLLLILTQVFLNGIDYFVKYITKQDYYYWNGISTAYTLEECFYMYGGLVLAAIMICYTTTLLFLNACMKSSNKLHSKMFECLLNAPMRFFYTNPSGRILNRFSKDMGSVDELLPKIMLTTIQIFFVAIGILFMVAIELPIMIIALLIAVILYGMTLKFYLRPSQDLKRIEGITKSPVFSYLSNTLAGQSTIRSRGLQLLLTKEFDNLQNVHSSIWQIMLASAAGFGVWLDCISIAVAACVIFTFISVHDRQFSGNAGLAISQALYLTGFVQFGFKQVTELLQHITSVERILQYSNIEQELQSKEEPQKNWPENGTIKFNNMSLRYDPNEGPILKNLYINIESNWKVGIIGRTGAGKSSIINAIFRLSSIEGEILIDGIDTSTISLESLRSKISIIPQDPVLFSASIRYNLDPFNLYTDEVLWKALEDVELKQSVISLDFMVTESGSNFSVGQRQLICLARTILRNNKILILDEATANCDPQTDILIQNTIRNKFKLCTVLTVAHRLHTVMDSDRILVMDDGYAKEFDIPHLLLQKDNSILKNLVEVTGPQESGSLKRTAYNKYKELIND